MGARGKLGTFGRVRVRECLHETVLRRLFIEPAERRLQAPIKLHNTKA